MPKVILGKKLGMTQIFEGNRLTPVTVITAGPCTVTAIKKIATTGQTSLQLGLAVNRRVKKPVRGQTKDLGVFSLLKEFRLPAETEAKVGDQITVSDFEVGDVVSVSGLNKAKGYQGVIKRHGFTILPKTHGQKNRQRHPGSIGSVNPPRVLKGLKMAGRMGGERVTVRGLRVVGVAPEQNALLVKGAVPGREGSVLEIRSGVTRLGRPKGKIKKN